MRIAHFFIERPIFAGVLSIFMVILGAIGYVSLPISQYPEVVPPTIVVHASYPGASPQVVGQTVATPIEQAVNGVEDMLYMSSQCTSDGQMALTITFRLGTDLDKAQVLVQNRVSTAVPRLPQDVQRLGVTTVKSSPDLLLVVHLVARQGQRDQLYISNYALTHVRDPLARIDGVGDVTLYGVREYSMRAWLDPEKLTHLALTPGDVVRALQEQNVQVASGIIGQPPVPVGAAFQLTVSSLGRLRDPDQFDAVIVKHTPGRVVRLKDVARVELGALDYSTNSYLDKEPAVAIVISQRPGANALATAEAVERKMGELAKSFPAGLEHRIVYNPTVFVRESIDAVLHTLLEAVLLVVFVVLLFLQEWRATLIPLAAIPVSIVGTFAVMAALGLSLNMLSLFGLVLAIGIVVDDAIVVVENVERHIAKGSSPREAAHQAMDEVTGAVIAIAFGLSAVFVPTAFLSGITGQFYRQFALTIAVSTVLSAFNSLTLSPALSALLLRPHSEKRDAFSRAWEFALGGFFRLFNRSFEKMGNVYARVVGRLVRKTAVPIALYLGLAALTALGFRTVPAGFIPAQDLGYLIIAIQLPDGASLERTDAVVRKALDTVLEVPGVEHAVSFAGFSGATRSASPNAGAIFVTQQPFEKRGNNAPTAAQLQAELQKRVMAIPDALIFVISPPPVQGLGTSGGYKFLVEDTGGGSAADLQTATDDLIAAARRDSNLRAVFTTFRASVPGLFADIDRVKANMLEVPVGNVFEALQVGLGSAYVNDFDFLGRAFQVRAQADGAFRETPEQVSRLRVRSSSGTMVPLGSLVNLRWESGPDRVVRYNMLPATEVLGDTAPGHSSSEAMAAIERLAAERLPADKSVEWTDLAFQQKLAGNTAIFIFPLCMLFVFLVHAAEYESWSLPLAIILIAPVSLPFALGGVWARGMDNNLITQIGFVVLIGLAAKNAVLIVEFAAQRQHSGDDRFTAAIEASRLRLRPIVMTALAFILGVAPMAFSHGPGFEMRQVLGTAVLTGMLGVTLFGLFLTPVFFVAIRGLSRSTRAIS